MKGQICLVMLFNECAHEIQPFWLLHQVRKRLSTTTGTQTGQPLSGPGGPPLTAVAPPPTGDPFTGQQHFCVPGSSCSSDWLLRSHSLELARANTDSFINRPTLHLSHTSWRLPGLEFSTLCLCRTWDAAHPSVMALRKCVY